MAASATPASPADAFLSPSPGMADTAGGRDMTPLQKHVAFFDRNNDGIIYPWEMYQGFRAIGAGVALSTGAALFINVSLGLKTRPGKWFSPFFPIYISNIHKGKHGSDTGVYDEEGQFIPARFEEMFKKYAQAHDNALTSNELMQMVKDNRDPRDYSGWFAAFLEWKLLYSFCKDKDGLLTKETIQAVYDGSLFLMMEKERAFEKGNASQKKMI